MSVFFTSSTVTIPSGETVSDALVLGGNMEPRRIIFPAAWTAATLSIELQDEAGGDWRDLYGGGAIIPITVNAGDTDRFDAGLTPHAYAMRLKSSTAQGAERVFTIVIGESE